MNCNQGDRERAMCGWQKFLGKWDDFYLAFVYKQSRQKIFVVCEADLYILMLLVSESVYLVQNLTN